MPDKKIIDFITKCDSIQSLNNINGKNEMTQKEHYDTFIMPLCVELQNAMSKAGVSFILNASLVDDDGVTIEHLMVTSDKDNKISRVNTVLLMVLEQLGAGAGNPAVKQEGQNDD